MSTIDRFSKGASFICPERATVAPHLHGSLIGGTRASIRKNEEFSGSCYFATVLSLLFVYNIMRETRVTYFRLNHYKGNRTVIDLPIVIRIETFILSHRPNLNALMKLTLSSERRFATRRRKISCVSLIDRHSLYYPYSGRDAIYLIDKCL